MNNPRTSAIMKGMVFLCVVSAFTFSSLESCSYFPSESKEVLEQDLAATVSILQETLIIGVTQTVIAEEAIPLTQTAVIQSFVEQMTQTAQASSHENQPQGTSTPIIVIQPSLSSPQDCNRAAFMADVSLPAQSVVSPGATFTKTWRVQNVGSCTWTSAYTLINQQTGNPSASLTNTSVPPGGMVDISVSLVAPLRYTPFEAYFLFKAQDGSLFGTGSKANQPLWVKVIVGAVAPTAQDQRARIQFAPGAISATLQGKLRANGVDYYVLRAMQGQTMTVNVLSPRGDALLTIYGITDGIPLVRGNASGATSFQDVLPLTQDYAVDIVSSGVGTEYTLQIIIK